ncbi:hypothetical protein HYPSUDRAFT_54415 [Hypholoma sublateritium FD-334 SS-4]|uniref:Uncharacterized protein n=1 Tax=Hypholoma sublateritium (strain FD-334 SS-4) TaxID=945553 RepID=A0A0D2L7T7_HYPSF|nr:hypothetical protein HYPSUDRAFT_54415 [Hypholoma sublateritium FD-334 SS-4]
MLSQRGWAVVLFLNIAFIISRTFLCGVGKTKHTYIGEDYPMRLPVKLEPVQAQFDCSVRYSLNSSVTEEVWTKSTDTASGGIIRLGPDRRVFAIAMYHQLHCLAGLSKALTATNHTSASDGHVGHCLNYLRQVFECSADATEEPVVAAAMLKSEGCAPPFIRQCSNWSTLYDYISANYLAFHEFKVKNGTWSCTGNERIEKGTGTSNRPAQADLCVMSATGQDIPGAHEH